MPRIAVVPVDGIDGDVVVHGVGGEVLDVSSTRAALPALVAEPLHQIDRVAHDHATIMTAPWERHFSLERGTAVEPLGGGRYRRAISTRRGTARSCRRAGSSPPPRPGRWTAALGDPAQTLRPVSRGVRRTRCRRAPVEIDVTVLRRGRTISQLQRDRPQPRRRRRASPRSRCSASAREGFDVHRHRATARRADRRTTARRSAIRRRTDFASSTDDRSLTSGSTSRAAPRSAIRRGRTTSPRRRCARVVPLRRPAPRRRRRVGPARSRRAVRHDAGRRRRTPRSAGEKRRWLPPSADFTVSRARRRARPSGCSR